MIKKILIVILGLGVGILVGYMVFAYASIFSGVQNNLVISPLATFFHITPKKHVVGFLPYWLIGKKDTDYTKYVTTLSYFSLTVNPDGTIQKYVNPGELEPGWNTLQSGKVDTVLAQAKKKHITLSLTIMTGDNDAINELMSEPEIHANQLLEEVTPLMKTYGFTDLNFDIESTIRATDGARLNYTKFVKTLKERLSSEKIGTLTIDISPISLFRNDLIDSVAIAPYIDYLFIMGYDYHYTGSLVAGPISPLSGAGDIFEFDIMVAVDKALSLYPPDKIILGLPIYGYEWETLSGSQHSAIISRTGLVASNSRIESLLQSCATCSAVFDETAQESIVSYKDENTNTYHYMNYPDMRSMQAKVQFARDKQLGGLGLWALGYEDSTVLEPLVGYLR
jgi:spore germination protein YaaH